MRKLIIPVVVVAGLVAGAYVALQKLPQEVREEGIKKIKDISAQICEKVKENLKSFTPEDEVARTQQAVLEEWDHISL